MVLYLFIFRILDLLNTILVICRCSVLCLITCFFNYTALYLLPLAIIVDWGIFQFSIQSVFKNQLLDLNKAVEEFKEQGIDLEIIEDDIIKEIDTEMRKYQLFQWGNRQGDKRTIVIRANKLFGQFKSFAFYNASSFIFVPKTFYPQSMKDRILLAHEFAHCVSHDLMLAFKRQFYCSAIILPLFVLVSDIPAWMKISAILLASVLALLQFWPIAYNEIIANNHALEVVNTLYGAKSMSESAKYLLKVRTETLRKNIKDKRYGLAYAIEELQIEHLQRSVSENALIQQSSPMNVWLSIIHYSLFALAGYACYSFVKEMNVSWYMLIMALIAFILIYVLSKINVTKIWIIKNYFGELEHCFESDYRRQVERFFQPDRLGDHLRDQFVDASDTDRVEHGFEFVGIADADMAVSECIKRHCRLYLKLLYLFRLSQDSGGS